MNEIEKRISHYIWSVGLAIIVITVLSAKPQDEQTKAYYSRHESEILPDAQTAFRNANYKRAKELCEWYYIIVGDNFADELKSKASRCASLSIEMKELEAVGNMDSAQQIAGNILLLNPHDGYAQKLFSSVSAANIAVPSNVSGDAAKYYPDAVKGDARSQYLLGDCYYYGTGVGQDYAEAVKWYRKSAEQGNAMAQRNLGLCYEYGKGISQDYSEAKRWYMNARDNGEITSREYLDRIVGKMTPTTGTLNGHEWVDLGLPSGLKWATCNVGASLPSDYGSYFAWGEISPKSNYSWTSYKWFNGSTNSFTKYNNDSENGTVDNKFMLDLSDDAARANWGNGWRMPTDVEMTELREQCTWTWTMQGGKNGYKVASKKNGNSIFLPAAGYRGEGRFNEVGSSGRYWPSFLYTEDPYLAWSVVFGSGGFNRHVNLRYYGFSVRPITE